MVLLGGFGGGWFAGLFVSLIGMVVKLLLVLVGCMVVDC